mgnify:FL=1
MIKDEIGKIITEPEHRASILENYDVLAEKLGTPGASQKTASLIVQYLKN